jgi:hypothetical protein
MLTIRLQELVTPCLRRNFALKNECKIPENFVTIDKFFSISKLLRRN